MQADAGADATETQADENIGGVSDYIQFAIDEMQVVGAESPEAAAEMLATQLGCTPFA